MTFKACEIPSKIWIAKDGILNAETATRAVEDAAEEYPDAFDPDDKLMVLRCLRLYRWNFFRELETLVDDMDAYFEKQRRDERHDDQHDETTVNG